MGLHTPNPSKIEPSGNYALCLKRGSGFRQNQVVRIENISHEAGTLTAITSAGSVTEGVRMGMFSPETYKFWFVEDFKPFKKGDVVVTFEEVFDNSGSILVYNFKGKSSRVSEKFLKFISS